MGDGLFEVIIAVLIMIGMGVLYILSIAVTVFVAGYIILWLLQFFHVIGGCVC